MSGFKLAELFSLGLTVPTVGLAIAVVVIWGRKVFELKLASDLSSTDMLILGVWVAFAGSAFDNSFWFVYWTLSFLDHPAVNQMERWGPVSNIVFRQASGILAGYLHALSFCKFLNEKPGGPDGLRSSSRNVSWCLLLPLCAFGLIYAIVLAWWRSGH